MINQIQSICDHSVCIHISRLVREVEVYLTNCFFLISGISKYMCARMKKQDINPVCDTCSKRKQLCVYNINNAKKMCTLEMQPITLYVILTMSTISHIHKSISVIKHPSICVYNVRCYNASPVKWYMYTNLHTPETYKYMYL